MTGGCDHRCENFESLFGPTRGGGVDRDTELPRGAFALPFRTVKHRRSDRVFDPVDRDVAVCERCASGGTLWRDWDDDRLPAMCGECHEELGTAVAENSFCCEDYCRLTDLDHDGLCDGERPGLRGQ